MVGIGLWYVDTLQQDWRSRCRLLGMLTAPQHVLIGTFREDQSRQVGGRDWAAQRLEQLYVGVALLHLWMMGMRW